MPSRKHYKYRQQYRPSPRISNDQNNRRLTSLGGEGGAEKYVSRNRPEHQREAWQSFETFLKKKKHLAAAEFYLLILLQNRAERRVLHQILQRYIFENPYAQGRLVKDGVPREGPKAWPY